MVVFLCNFEIPACTHILKFQLFVQAKVLICKTFLEEIYLVRDTSKLLLFIIHNLGKITATLFWNITGGNFTYNTTLLWVQLVFNNKLCILWIWWHYFFKHKSWNTFFRQKYNNPSPDKLQAKLKTFDWGIPLTYRLILYIKLRGTKNT